ncbi:MAG TPA: restriction endonuclease subunit S [Blastocatellia bacterium]|nr:restriction endonuclease subunit S [Blastocatellia bacterium]
MTYDLKPYANCKDSGVSWLGKIPTHWDIKSGFAAYREKHEKNIGLIEKTVLSLSYGRIIIKPPEKLHGLVPESFETYQVINPGDVIIRATDLQNDQNSLRVGLARDRGIITSAYLCLRPTGLLSSEYGYYVLHAYDLAKIFYGMGSGLRQNLSFRDIKRMPVIVPPDDEQRAIAWFLDHFNRHIDHYIHLKKKRITLLNEQKQAVINQAVSCGLDPNVQLKTSGIPWLGDIPEHWETRRIKYLIREADCRSTTGSETLLSMRMHHGLVPFAEHFTRPPQSATLVGFKVVLPGQIVVNRMQAGNGLIFASRLKGLVSPDYAVFDPLGDVNVEYLGELFRSRKVRAKFRAESKGLGTGTSGFLRLYNDRLGAIPVALPPRPEQDAILERLSEQLHNVNASIATTEREIELIREYRIRLITDVVTGRFDVREAAANLPEEVDEPVESLEGDEAIEEDPEMLVTEAGA